MELSPNDLVRAINTAQGEIKDSIKVYGNVLRNPNLRHSVQVVRDAFLREPLVTDKHAIWDSIRVLPNWFQNLKIQQYSGFTRLIQNLSSLRNSTVSNNGTITAAHVSTQISNRVIIRNLFQRLFEKMNPRNTATGAGGAAGTAMAAGAFKAFLGVEVSALPEGGAAVLGTASGLVLASGGIGYAIGHYGLEEGLGSFTHEGTLSSAIVLWDNEDVPPGLPHYGEAGWSFVRDSPLAVALREVSQQIRQAQKKAR